MRHAHRTIAAHLGFCKVGGWRWQRLTKQLPSWSSSSSLSPSLSSSSSSSQYSSWLSWEGWVGGALGRKKMTRLSRSPPWLLSWSDHDFHHDRHHNHYQDQIIIIIFIKIIMMWCSKGGLRWQDCPPLPTSIMGRTAHTSFLLFVIIIIICIPYHHHQHHHILLTKLFAISVITRTIANIDNFHHQLMNTYHLSPS